MSYSSSENGVSWKWIAGLVIGILLSVLSYAAVAIQERVDKVEAAAIAASHKANLIEERYNEIIRRLSRIEVYVERYVDLRQHGR